MDYLGTRIDPDGPYDSRTGIIMQPDKWYEVQTWYYRANGIGYMKLWIDGKKEIDTASPFLGNDSTTSGQLWYPGIAHTQDTGTGTKVVYIDETVAADGYIEGTGGVLGDTIPPTATITAPTAAQLLVAGTTSTALSVSTDETATCKYSTGATDTYAQMGNAMSDGGSSSHTATLTGFVNGGSYTYYVRCQDAASTQNNMTTSANVSFSVANTAPTYRAGDLNSDGTVNLQDVILIIQNFKRRGNYDTGADINNDGIVNIFDMVLLGRNWGGTPTGAISLEPTTGDVVVYDDDFSGYSSIAARRAQRSALIAGIQPFYFFDGPNSAVKILNTDKEADEFIITPGYGGSAYAYRLNFTYADRDAYNEQTMSGVVWHNSGQTYDFAPDNAKLIVDIWVRTNFVGTDFGWVKGLEMFHDAGDRTQYGFWFQSTHSLGWANLNPQSSPYASFMHQEDAAADAPVRFKRFANIADNTWHRHTYVYKKNTQTGTTEDGIAQYYVDGEKVIDVSSYGLANGWLVDRQNGVDPASTNPYPGNAGFRYSDTTGRQSLRALADDPVNEILFPGIVQWASNGGTQTMDIGRMRVWYRE